MKRIIFIVFLIALISCESKIKYKKPDNLIPREEMINLLIDMHIATGTTTVKEISEEKNINYMVLVYEKYQIDSTRFAESNFYYISNIDEYESIFREVKKQLKEIQDVYSLKIDSLDRIKMDSSRAKMNIPKDIPKRLGEADIVK